MTDVKMIYSDSLSKTLCSGFTYKKHHWTWNDDDCLYYRDDVDDCWCNDVPEGAVKDTI
jgi:hypothetical protein